MHLATEKKRIGYLNGKTNGIRTDSDVDTLSRFPKNLQESFLARRKSNPFTRSELGGAAAAVSKWNHFLYCRSGVVPKTETFRK